MSRRDFAFTTLGCVVTALGFVGLQVARVWPPHGRHLLGDGATSSASSAASSAATAPSPTATTADDEAWRTANANLAETVKLTQRRLEQNEVEKKKLETALKQAQARLAASEGDGAIPRNEFDLTQDDWKQLAKDGTVKARFPCVFKDDWHVTPEKATELGLAPTDAPALEAAYRSEEGRIWTAIEPGCAKIVGGDELARRLGPSVCLSVIQHSVKDTQPDQQLVADIRAGNRPAPPADQLDPFATMLLVESGAMQAMEADLAQTMSPADAHRMTFSDELGSCTSSWGGPRPKR